MNTMNDNTLSDYSKKFSELKTIFDSLPDGIVAIINKDMVIVAANHAVTKLLNLTPRSIVGNSVEAIFKKRSPALYEVIQQTIQNKKGIRNFTVEYIANDSTANSFLVSTAIIKEISKRDMGIVLILHDVSEITRLRKMSLQVKRYGEIIGDSRPMKNIFEMIESIKDFDTSVLIVGETGTGKELVARAIHEESKRKNNPFIPINCSALSFNLIESELFGHVKGAFTGAFADRPGRFLLADGGTLFLDEVGTLSMDIQVKLLRAIQQKVIEPVGSSKSKSVNVRIISASNRNLSELVKENKFRDDLLYRLKIFQLTLPALRKRIEDVPLLVDYFIERLNHYYNKSIIGISPNALDILTNYQWPGNVRELENAIEHAFVLTTGSIIEMHTLPLDIQCYNEEGKIVPPSLTNLNIEEEKIRKALLSTKGNMEEAAVILNIHRSTLWRKMKEFRISKGFGKN